MPLLKEERTELENGNYLITQSGLIDDTDITWKYVTYYNPKDEIHREGDKPARVCTQSDEDFQLEEIWLNDSKISEKEVWSNGQIRSYWNLDLEDENILREYFEDKNNIFALCHEVFDIDGNAEEQYVYFRYDDEGERKLMPLPHLDTIRLNRIVIPIDNYCLETIVWRNNEGYRDDGFFTVISDYVSENDYEHNATYNTMIIQRNVDGAFFKFDYYENCDCEISITSTNTLTQVFHRQETTVIDIYD